VAEDREVREQELQKVCRGKTKIFAKSRRAISIQTIGSGRARGRDPCISEEEPFGEKSRGEYPKSWEAEVILVVHRGRTRGKDQHIVDSQIGRSRVGRREDSRSPNS
jgi:hypothetical protein